MRVGRSTGFDPLGLSDFRWGIHSNKRRGLEIREDLKIHRLEIWLIQYCLGLQEVFLL